jgi:hypothetical protein
MSEKPLNGIAHDIAHHANSGLSFLYPHLWQACSSTGVLSATVELLEPEPYPLGLVKLKPLQSALATLLKRFWEIVEIKGLLRSSMASVNLRFFFPTPPTDGSLFAVESSVKTTSGKVFVQYMA